MLVLERRYYLNQNEMCFFFKYKNGILTNTSNAKCFRNVTLIYVQGLAEIIVQVGGYGRHSPNQVMIKRE